MVISDPLALPAALQKHWDVHGARMEKSVGFKGHTIYLADGGPHHDAKNRRVVKHEPGPGEILEEDKWMIQGYYVSAWGVLRGKAVMGSPLYFKLNHDLNLTKEGRKQARLESALEAAESVINDMINVGLLEHTEGGIIIPNSPALYNETIH